MCVPVMSSYKPEDSYHRPWEQGILSPKLRTHPGWMWSWCLGVTSQDSGLTASSGESVLSLDSRGFEDSLDPVDVVTHTISVNKKCGSIKGNCPMIFFPLTFQPFFFLNLHFLLQKTKTRLKKKIFCKYLSSAHHFHVCLCLLTPNVWVICFWDTYVCI